MAVSYTVHHDSKGSDTFIPDKPRVWAAKLSAAASAFGTATVWQRLQAGSPMWDLHPDGKRIAVVSPANVPEAPESDHEVVFLQNFFDELRRKAPLK